MEILINNIKNFSKKEQTIVIKENIISLIEGNSCYERVLSKNQGFINDVESKLLQIMFGWKEEYIGSRLVDGERYHIVVDVNHKKRKYKIQNKFPDNWEEFLQVEKSILEGAFYD